MERECKYCYKPLVHKEQETNFNWAKREYCDKHCASSHRNEKPASRKRTGEPVVIEKTRVAPVVQGMWQ